MINLDKLEKTIEHAVLWTVNEVPSDALVKLKDVFSELRAAREALELADKSLECPPLSMSDCADCGAENVSLMYRREVRQDHKPDCQWQLTRTAIDKWKEAAK